MGRNKGKKYLTDNAPLIAEWNWEKNIDVDPSTLTLGSGKKVWWQCPQKHEWQAAIDHRNRGDGCPFCAGRCVVAGENDLQTVNPDLAKEWNYEKNSGLRPIDFLPNSSRKVWWKCSNGHEWNAVISSRNKGKGCPYCSGRYAIKGKNDLQTINPTLASEWHYEKNEGITPENVLPNSAKKVWWKCSKGHEWNATINSRSGGRGCPVCNSERQTSFPEYVLLYYLKKYALEAIHSYKKLGYELDIYIPSKRIAIEYDGYFWHKNKREKDLKKNLKCKKDGIQLYRIREELPSLDSSSIDYVILKNQKNLSVVVEKILEKIIEANVDVDIGRDFIEIENLRKHTEKEGALSSSNPTLSQEWDFDKNGSLKPENFLTHSGKKVWWKCSKGHEWQATIAARSDGGGCPYCSGKKVLAGYNDLKTINPALAEEWNCEKNAGLTPADVMPNSNKKVWWRCQEGHEWRASVAHRNKDRGCPYCAGRHALKGKTDLKRVNPVLASEWDCERNEGLTPEDVLPNSSKKVWWKCRKGHGWQAIIQNRNKGHGCPYCSGKKVLVGYNDLKTINPSLAEEWNCEKNAGLTPADVMPNSNKKVWWRCQQGHEWRATVAHRNIGDGCPYCSGRYAIKGTNDLQMINPLLAKEWNYKKNDGLTPSDVLPNSNKKVWWKCSKGHEWQATINNRNRGTGCPYCSGRKK